MGHDCYGGKLQAGGHNAMADRCIQPLCTYSLPVCTLQLDTNAELVTLMGRIDTYQIKGLIPITWF